MVGQVSVAMRSLAVLVNTSVSEGIPGGSGNNSIAGKAYKYKVFI